MPVETKQVQGRRSLHFDSLGEVVADAEQLVSAPRTKMLGNWPLDKLLAHLTVAINHSIDGIAAKAPWYIRLVGPFFKQRFITRGMPAGFKLPKQAESDFFPAAGSSQAALDGLRAAVDRAQNEKMTARHPVLGPLTHEEWNQLHLRHSELHLSFALPE